MLEALCARIFSLDSWISVFPDFYLCVCVQALWQSLPSAPLNQAPVTSCRYSSCVLIVYVCLCVCASVCACKNV